jgi:hypothetical protein
LIEEEIHGMYAEAEDAEWATTEFFNVIAESLDDSGLPTYL